MPSPMTQNVRRVVSGSHIGGVSQEHIKTATFNSCPSTKIISRYDNFYSGISVPSTLLAHTIRYSNEAKRADEDITVIMMISKMCKFYHCTVK